MTVIPATIGTATIAPRIPPAEPPMSRLTRTRNGDSPTVLRMTIGTRTLPSMAWMRR